MMTVMAGPAFKKSIVVGIIKSLSITSTIRLLENFFINKLPVQSAGKLCKGKQQQK